MAGRTRGGLQLLPLISVMVATCWFADLYSVPQAVWGRVKVSGRRWGLLDKCVSLGWGEARPGELL